MESKIEELLHTTTIPLNYKRSNMSGYRYTGNDKRRYGNGIRSATLGEVRDYSTGGKRISNFTKNNLKLYNLLCEYGSTITDIPFKSICINKNTIAEPHVDRNNRGVSCIVGLGDYAHGELVYGEIKVNIHKNPIEFDGSKVIHYSLPFEGTRYSIIYFQ
jgi:hypothetical protein